MNLVLLRRLSQRFRPSAPASNGLGLLLVWIAAACSLEPSGNTPWGVDPSGSSSGGSGGRGSSAADAAGPGPMVNDSSTGPAGDDATSGPPGSDASPGPGADDAATTIDDGSTLDDGASGDAQWPMPPDGGVAASPIGTGWTEIFPTYSVDNPPGQVRYTVTGDEIHYWLFNTDMSTYPGQDAGPRSEFHWHNDYTTGQAQFQADLMIDQNCARACVMQIFGAPGRATAFMAWAMPDALSYYSIQTIVSPVYDTWLRLNVVHDTATGLVDVYIDGQHKYQVMDHGAANHYFKNGIYHQANMTARCDVYYKGIHIFRQ
jgi:hypothetical protein